MASNAGWNEGVPSDQSPARLGASDIRSTKTFLENWLNEEHFTTDGSTNSAGVHKMGSARGFRGPTSALSNAQPGRFFHATDTNFLYLGNASGWSQLPAGVSADASNDWTAFQRYIRTSPTLTAFNTRDNSDTDARFTLLINGEMRWGDGSIAPNLTLGRASGGDRLQVGGGITVEGSHTVETNLGVDGSSRFGVGGTPVTKILSASSVVDLPSITSQTFSNFTLGVSGAVPGDFVAVNNPVLQDSFNLQTFAHVSANDVVQVVVKNDGLATTSDPSAATFRVVVMQF